MSLKWSTNRFLNFYARKNYRDEITEIISKDILLKLEGIDGKVSKEQIAIAYEQALIEKYPTKQERDSVISIVGLFEHEIMYMTIQSFMPLERRYEQFRKHIIITVDKLVNDEFYRAEREKLLRPVKEASKSIGNAFRKVSESYEKVNEISEQYLGANIYDTITNEKILGKDVVKRDDMRNMRSTPGRMFRRLCIEIENKIDDFLEGTTGDTNKIKSTESAQDKERANVQIRAKSIDELNEFIKDIELYLPKERVNFDNEINELQLRVGIDRSKRTVTPYESRWDSGERIVILLQVQARLLEPEFKERITPRNFLVKFGDVKIKPILGEKITPKKSIDYDYGLTFPYEARIVEYIEKDTLSESEMLDLLYVYHTRIFDSLNKDEKVLENIPFILFDESISPDYPNIDDCDGNVRHRDENNWSRADLNEYYGYESDYEGDWD